MSHVLYDLSNTGDDNTLMVDNSNNTQQQIDIIIVHGGHDFIE